MAEIGMTQRTSQEVLQEAIGYRPGIAGCDLERSLSQASWALARGATLTGEDLIQTALFGSLRLVELFVNSGVDINQMRADYLHNNSVLHGVVRQHPWKTQQLIDLGADVRIVDGRGFTPLHSAMEYSEIDTHTALVLLKAGAGVHAKDNLGQTPLHIAASRNYPDDVSKTVGDETKVLLLLEMGANINEKDNEGATPLILVAQALERAKTGSYAEQLYRMAEILVKNGASRYERNNAEKTADDYLTAGRRHLWSERLDSATQDR